MNEGRIKEITPEEVADRLRRGERLVVLDVREPHEWVTGHIPGAKHIPLGQLPDRIHELDASLETVIICKSGVRSAAACEFLEYFGFKVANVAGGMLAWAGDVEFGD
jgi:rhodanese-related sulfurtransferase